MPAPSSISEPKPGSEVPSGPNSKSEEIAFEDATFVAEFDGDHAGVIFELDVGVLGPKPRSMPPGAGRVQVGH